MKKYLLLLLSLLFFCCSSQQLIKESYPYDSVHLMLGLPTDDDPTDDYIIVRHQYTLSYNKNLNVSNWVAWQLNKNWFGSVKRYRGNFLVDTLLPPDFYRVTHNDYTRSGFDRGHMVRSEERTDTEENNISTFYLTNILPQTPDLNQGVWFNLEKHLENLCKQQNKELYIIAGGIFHTNKKINNLVAIPDSCFKIVVILDRGQTLKDITEQTPIIAVVMPNIQSINRKDKWETYRTTINRIENSTGYIFLSRVDEKIREVLKSK
jgi:endonuclease G